MPDSRACHLHLAWLVKLKTSRNATLIGRLALDVQVVIRSATLGWPAFWMVGVISIGCLFPFLVLMGSSLSASGGEDADLIGVPGKLIRDARFWLALLCSTVAALLPDVLAAGMQRLCAPRDYQILQVMLPSYVRTRLKCEHGCRLWGQLAAGLMCMHVPPQRTVNHQHHTVSSRFAHRRQTLESTAWSRSSCLVGLLTAAQGHLRSGTRTCTYCHQPQHLASGRRVCHLSQSECAHAFAGHADDVFCMCSAEAARLAPI